MVINARKKAFSVVPKRPLDAKIMCTYAHYVTLGSRCKMASSSSEDEADTWPERPTRIQPESVVPLWCVGRRSLLSLCDVCGDEVVVPLWCVGRRNLLSLCGVWGDGLLSLCGVWGDGLLSPIHCGVWGDEVCCSFVISQTFPNKADPLL